jgi:hypothetical protein
MVTSPTREAVADLVIQCLIEDEFELVTRVKNLEQDLFWYREIAREATHILHAKHRRITQLEQRLSEINAERRADRAAA